MTLKWRYYYCYLMELLGSLSEIMCKALRTVCSKHSVLAVIIMSFPWLKLSDGTNNKIQIPLFHPTYSYVVWSLSTSSISSSLPSLMSSVHTGLLSVYWTIPRSFPLRSLYLLSLQLSLPQGLHKSDSFF